jgi:hypothetical protein
MGKLKQLKKKQKAREGKKPPVDLLTPEQKVIKRREQSETLKQKIIEKFGLPVMNEIKEFLFALDAWVITGEASEGTCWIPKALNDLDWKLYSQIDKYPEIWFRAPKEFTEDDSDSETDDETDKKNNVRI